MTPGKKKRKVVDSSADSMLSVGSVAVLVIVAIVIIWAVRFILFTPVGGVMMHWSVFVTRLQVVLAQIFSGREVCIQLCNQAGVETSRINFDEPSYVRWFHILDEAMKQETLDKLLVEASRQYPGNSALNKAMGEWSESRGLPTGDVLSLADVFQASVVRDLADIDARVMGIEAALMALAAGREAEIEAGTVSQKAVPPV